MKLLIVAMSDSVHTARWVSQISDQGWDIHLFPSVDCGAVHPEMRNLTVYHSVYGKRQPASHKIKYRGICLVYEPAVNIIKSLLEKIFPHNREWLLARVIKNIRPDIIHSMEIQHAGYLTANVNKIFHKKFPPWIMTNWGSDIYLFGRLSQHESKIKEVLSLCDFYSCECNRDIALAYTYGFKGKVLPVFPNSGGFDLNSISNLRQAGQVADRRKIMLKGYQNWAGRALVGLRALERCVDLLKGYEIIIYSAASDVIVAAELFQKSTGIVVTCMPLKTPHLDILRFHGQARISIGLSIGDAISTSFLEALVMGSFPIQSWTSCAEEWIEDGHTGILVPPEDPEVVEKAIRRALTDDELVNRASTANYTMARKRLDQSVIKQKIVNLYNQVIRERYGDR
jgi:hypothetical protein